MRSKAIFTLSLLFQVFYGAAQFLWSNPQPSGYSNIKVEFSDAATGYIMNYNGDLIKTNNSGASWNIQKNFPRCVAMDVQDSFLVIGGGDTTVYLSTDNAQSWKKGTIKQNQVIEKIQIISKDTIFALSKNYNIGTTELFQSKDGGLSWQLINGSFIIKAVDFINSKLGYATSFGGVYKTIDGGLSWQKIYTQTRGYSFITLKFFDKNIGYACQDLGVVIKTTDGGVTWNVCLSSTDENIRSISFGNASTIFLGGDGGAIYRSTDNGTTWQSKPNHLAYAYNIYDICFLNASTGYLVGHRGQILKTTDGGDTYQDYAPTYVDIKPISFPEPSTGYAASWNDLFKTSDSGKTWTKLPFSLSDQSERFENLSFFSKDEGIAISESPVRVFKTYNGGQNWQPIKLPILYKDYIEGFFVLGNTVYVNINGAYGYTILQSKDKGESWSIQSQNTQGGYQNLFFTDEKNGYSTIGPQLYKTTDSAKTWSRVSMVNDYNYRINSIWFTSAAIGYLVGDGGFNNMTVDSGRTWTQFKIDPDNYNFNDVYAIRFFTKKVGYLTSKYGGIYKTFDGGKNWKPEKSSPWECKTIEMASDTSIYLTGEYGTILKKDIREYSIDSLKVTLQASCSAKISANVLSVLSQVDSIWFEYGTSDYSHIIAATPGQVNDSSVKCETLLQNLSDSNYVVRVKIYYRNAYYYSAPKTFRPTGALLPSVTITASSNPVCAGSSVIFSSTSTNKGTAPVYQWQVDGNNVGTNDSTYTAPNISNGSKVNLILTSNAGCTSPSAVSSNIITMSVSPVHTPSVIINASATQICPATSVNFTATATNGGTSPVYQWYVNGNLGGANSNTYNNNTLNNNDRIYAVLTSNAACLSKPSDTSNTIVITVVSKSKATGKTTSPGKTCVNKPFTVNFTGINTPVNSIVQLWESTNSSSYAPLTSQTYNGSVLNFIINNNNNAALRKYFFVITPPSVNTCNEANNSDTSITVIEQLSIPVIALNNEILTVSNPDADVIYNWQNLKSGNWQAVSSAATGLSYTAADNGTYRVQAIKGVCLEYSNSLIVSSVAPTQGGNELGIYLYPNPTTGTLILDSLKLTDNWASLEILSLDGSTVFANFNIENRTKVTVDVGFLKDGLYLAVLRTKTGSASTIKFVKI